MISDDQAILDQSLCGTNGSEMTKTKTLCPMKFSHDFMSQRFLLRGLPTDSAPLSRVEGSDLGEKRRGSTTGRALGMFDPEKLCDQSSEPQKR